jgi:BirA family transcriptional regulator, biotin operon repressor / biotin---[acetyl-CoA-carboxylase] ligase
MSSADSRNFKYKLIKLAKTTSTNTYAFKWAKQNKPEIIICIYSNNQTHGRGQGKNKWESLKGLNITASVVLRPNFILPKQQFLISMIISLAISRCSKSTQEKQSEN